MSVSESAEQYLQLLDNRTLSLDNVLTVFSTKFCASWFHLRYARLAFLLNALDGVLGFLYRRLEPLTELGTIKTAKKLVEKFARLLFLPLLTLQFYACHTHEDALTVFVVLGPACVYVVATDALGKYCLNGVLAYNTWLFLISVDSTVDCSLLGLVSLVMYFVVPANSYLYLLLNIASVVAANSCLCNLSTTKRTP